MPELPEVETTRLALSQQVLQQPIQHVAIHQSQLRYPVPDALKQLIGQRFIAITRRGKYLVLTTDQQQRFLIHLGMSGSLRVVPVSQARQRHDHIEIHFIDGQALRYRDPRRFGLWLCLDQDDHPLLATLGPEPLSDAFDLEYVWQHTRLKRVAIKKWLMNSRCVVGVGNIYANEALFQARLHPLRVASSLTKAEAKRLVTCVKTVLAQAIEVGGTTLKDFLHSDGQPGYFRQQLHVYGRGDQACVRCQTTLQQTRLDNRTTVFCNKCQH